MKVALSSLLSVTVWMLGMLPALADIAPVPEDVAPIETPIRTSWSLGILVFVVGAIAIFLYLRKQHTLPKE